MKTVKSNERSTGRGAKKFEAVLRDGEWVAVSDLPASRYLGRYAGEERYEVVVSDEALSAHFYRSNSGRERVMASNGLEWGSFDEAKRWANGQYDNDKDGTMTVTGRQLREICTFAEARRGCAIPPEEHLEAPWYFDAEAGELDDDDRIAVSKVILYFDEEETQQ